MSTQVVPGRHTADPDGEVVVFLIGMRVNRWRSVGDWLPVARAMGPMVAELSERPELGLLGVHTFRAGRMFLLVQYWRSFEHLERFARDPEGLHLPAWREFNGRARRSPAVGIFHETYVVPAGSTESVYSNMPVFGLAAATRHVTVASKGEAARQRLATTAPRAGGDDAPEPVPAPPR